MMRFASSLGQFGFFFLCNFLTFHLLVGQPADRVCRQINQRKEWRTLDEKTRASYLNAVSKCLIDSPSVLNTEFDLRHYDDFQYVHASVYRQVHFTARFFSWHRHFVYLYEQSLKRCGYKGAMPYWNWSLDANDASRAPVWGTSKRTAFGRNGTGPVDPRMPDDGGQVIEGAFGGIQLVHPFPHALHRLWDPFLETSAKKIPYFGEHYDAKAIQKLQQRTDFWDFTHGIEGLNPDQFPDAPVAPHAAIHTWIGGDMDSAVHAANDPIFYLHHAQIDKVWSDWQNVDRATRLRAYHGNNVRGSQVDNGHLGDFLPFLGLGGRDPTVREVMDTTAFPYCYTYV